MKVVEPPPLSDTTCSSSPRPATVSKYQRIKMDFSVPFVLYFCTFYILYFLHLVWHNLHFFAETVSRQSISTDQKFIPVGKKFLQRTNNGRNKTIWREDFCDIWLSRKMGNKKKSIYQQIKNLFPLKKVFAKNDGKTKTIWWKEFCDIWLPRKMGNKKYIPNQQKTKNS